MQNGPAGTENSALASLARFWPSSGEIAGLCAFVGCYLAIVGWFKWIDVYHTYFATEGVLVVAYNFLRAVFAFYLFWIVSAPGAILIRALARAGGKTSFTLGAADAVPLSFFTGAGLWHLILLALGYLDLYTVPVALVLTVPA